MKKLLIIFTFLALMCFAAVNSNAQTDDKSDKSEKVSQKQTEDKPVKITAKPGISADVFNKCLKDSRNKAITVVLKVTFHSSGKITDVVIFQDSGCQYFNDEAIKAAKKIKFKAAVKNGEPITVTKTVSYQTGIY